MIQTIIDYLEEKGRPMNAFDIADGLGAPIEAVDAALGEMIAHGQILLTKKNRYARPDMLGLIPARAMVTRGGARFARPLDGSSDVRISREGDLRAMNGDEILVRPPRRHSDGGAYYLAAITKRAHETLIAVLEEATRTVEQPPVVVRKGRRKKVVHRPPEVIRYTGAVPCDPHLLCRVEVVGDLMGAKMGDTVALRVVDWPRRHVPLKAEVTRVLGDGNDLSVQLDALIESRHLETAFPPEVIAESEALAEPDDAEKAGRYDARGVTLFTIDGDDAKDFDDAVSLEKTENGLTLGVHIADVSHYVKRGGAIDREALRRGTSVYLPGRVIPMLPEKLCNDLCSLRPNVDRLSLSLFMEIQGDEIVSSHLERAVIHSRARLTYAEVNKLLDGAENSVPEELHETLFEMDALSRRLRAKREARGAIDFELAEPSFTLNEKGEPIDVQARVRGEAERLIEDFMLAANETIAEKAREAKLPLLYRVHERPDGDKLAVLENFLNIFGHPVHLGRDPQPRVLQGVLQSVAGTPEEAVVKSFMLRSLKRAQYSDKPLGHYALAARDYCHFTSPIRRYPDLTVHRMMKLLIAGQLETAQAMQGRMADLAAETSRCEYEAASLERDADDLVRTWYMKPHVGEVFDATVVSVTAWGFYVALDNTAEGLVRGGEPDEDYFYDEERQCLRSARSHRKIRSGDRVRVRLDSADVPARELTFTALWPDDGKRRKKSADDEENAEN